MRASIIDDLEDDPDHVLVTHNQRDPQVFDVYRVNVRSSAAELVARNPGNIVGWQTDHAGKLRAAVASDGLNTTLLYRDDEAAEFRPLITTDYRTSVHPAFFTFDDKLYAQSTEAATSWRWLSSTRQARCRGRNLRTAGSRPGRGRLLAQTPRADPGRLPDRQAAVQVLRRPDRNAVQEADGQAAGYDLALQGSNRDENKFIVAAYNDRTPGSRYLYDAASDTLSKLADLNPSLPESGMARVQPISYQSRDGLTIHGYLTLPAGRSEEPGVHRQSARRSLGARRRGYNPKCNSWRTGVSACCR